MRIILAGCLTLLVSVFAGCGDSGTSPATVQPAIVQPTTAVLKLSSQGASPALAGIGITVKLPAGVSVKTTADGAVDSSVVTVSGVAVPGSVATPVYTPATATTPGTLRFVVASTAAGGFGVGEFATVTCAIAPGSFPMATDFGLADFTPADLLLQPVTGLTPTFTAAMQ